MAAIRSGNTWFVDGSDQSLAETNIRVSGVILTSGGSQSELTLAELNSDASYPNKMTLKAAANDTKQIRLEDTPVVFTAGIRIKALTAGAVATLILTKAGS